MTTLNTRPLMFKESKLIADMMYQGHDEDYIAQKVDEENILQVSRVDRRQRLRKIIVKRLEELDPYLLEKFVLSDTITSKHILLYSLLSTDQLFYEWMREVVFDKWLTLDYIITTRDSLIFMDKKAEQSEKVKGWKATTVEKLIKAFHQALVDADYAREENEMIRLQRPIISPEVERYLKNEKEKSIVEVLLGEVIQ